MDDLIKLLTISEDTNDFDSIAKKLFNEYRIKKGNDKYDFAEIEFYLYTPKHRDVTTYPRTTNAGDWFFHMSGIDLSFKSEAHGDADNDIFGGILIRSIRDCNSQKIIAGPYNCMDILFDQFGALQATPNNFPHIIKEQSKHEIFKTVRWLPPFCGRTELNEDQQKKKIENHLKDKFNIASVENIEEYLSAIRPSYRYVLNISNKDIEYSNYKANPWINYTREIIK